MPTAHTYSGPNDMFGVFHEEQSIYIGDPFTKKDQASSRHRGKGFAAPYQPKGNGKDGMIDKTTPLTIPGDVYIDPMVSRRPQSASPSIHSKPFVPVGCTKKSCGSGSLYGIMGTPASLLDTDASLASGATRKADPVDKLRPMYTSPAKKGSFGFPFQDRTIGATRFEFVPDEYCRGRIIEKDMKKEARARIPKPFVSAGVTGRGITPICPVAAPDRVTETKRRCESANPSKRPAWRANNPSAKGSGYGCLSSIPYIPCPAPTTRQRPSSAPAKPFKPVGGSHQRLSMWSPNPYAYAARPAPNNDSSLLS